MGIVLACIATIVLWFFALVYFVVGGISTPQYASKKATVRYNVLFVSGLFILGVLLPAVSWWVALK